MDTYKATSKKKCGDELIGKAKSLLTECVWEDCKEHIKCLFMATCIIDSLDINTYETERIVNDLYEIMYSVEPVGKEEFHDFLVHEID